MTHWSWWVFNNCKCKHSLHVTFFLYEDHTGKWNKYPGSFVIAAICILVALLQLQSVIEEPISKSGFTLYSNFSTKKYPMFESENKFVMVKKIFPVVPSKQVMQEEVETIPIIGV